MQDDILPNLVLRLALCFAAQVFEINPLKAWSAVAITLSSVAASLYLISVSPWYLLPFAWFIAGTAFTGVSLLGVCGVGGRGDLESVALL